ncbi:helix-turn-helix domain-containing protein [Schaalia sp.]|uniref:helix-turn-helix domain-containing protein n=1 Tax=Schaalia sp. TaxID=2691890 RepID=UPI003D0CAE88
MATSQTIVSREVRQFMTATAATQCDISKILGVSQSQVSARLHGRARWTFSDLDALRDAGVPIALSAYSIVDPEEVGA